MVFCIAILCLGVIGNIMVPIVILKTKDMRNSTNIFLTNLSIADLLVLLVCTPTVLVEVNTRPETWVLGQEMCKAVPFVELTVAHASVLTILAISFERYYAICEPLKAGYVCTKTRAILICITAWIVAALFTSPILLFAEYSNADYIDGTRVAICVTQASNPWTITFFLMIISLFFLLPLMVLLILYTIIAKNLISNDISMMKMRPNKPELSNKARKQVVLMLGAVVLSFFTCLLPFRVLTLWIIIVPDENVHGLGIEKYYNILYFCRIMLYLNSAINPILYNLMSSKFRKGFKRLCCCGYFHSKRNQKKRRRQQATLNTTTTSSFLTQSINSRKNSDKMTMSLDDLRIINRDAENEMDRKLYNWYGTNLIRQCSTPFLTATSPVAAAVTTTASNNKVILRKGTDNNESSSEELRKMIMKNFIRQKSTQSDEAHDAEADHEKCHSRRMSYNGGSRQNEKIPKTQLFFQDSLNEIKSRKSFKTNEASKQTATGRCRQQNDQFYDFVDNNQRPNDNIVAQSIIPLLR